MKPTLLLALVAVLAVGCALSKDESTLSRLHDEMAAKKKKMPEGTFTEETMGVHYYPGAELAQNRQYDEGGAHILEQTFGTPDSADKVRDFFEKDIGGKAMPTTAGMYSIQKDKDGKHYEIGYGRFGDDTTIVVKVYTKTG